MERFVSQTDLPIETIYGQALQSGNDDAGRGHSSSDNREDGRATKNRETIPLYACARYLLKAPV
jgi:hypothetical protein